MIHFDTLFNTFENTKDVCKFCSDYKENDEAIRFLLIRSLDKHNLKEIIRQHSPFPTDGTIRQLTEKVYLSNVTVEQLVTYIESKRPELIQQRQQELEELPELLRDFPIVNCGVRNDKVDDIVKAFVRNKTLKTMHALTNELDSRLLPRIRQYSLWSYYNQTSNDIIELFFLKHPKVIPTLRKIRNIDFFLKIDGHIIPFDLKFTHISDSYFDLASQGMTPTVQQDASDDFSINPESDGNELKKIKAYYIRFKRAHPYFPLVC